MVEKRRARGCGRRCIKCWTNKLRHHAKDYTLIDPESDSEQDNYDVAKQLAPAEAIFPKIKRGRKGSLWWLTWQNGTKHRRRQLTFEETFALNDTYHGLHAMATGGAVGDDLYARRL
jgi:hypothetical protein